MKHAAKRAGKKAEEEAQALKAKEAATVLPCTISKQVDANGTELLKEVEQPLAEALKLAQNLPKYAPQDPHSFSLAYQVYSRKYSLLLCAKMLVKLADLETKMCANEQQNTKPDPAAKKLDSAAFLGQTEFGLNYFLLSELAPCLTHFCWLLQSEKGAAELKKSPDVITKEVFGSLRHVFMAILSRIGEALHSGVVDLDAVPEVLSSAEEAQAILEKLLVAPLKTLRVNTIKEHHARLRVLVGGGMGKEAVGAYVKALKPESRRL